MYSYSAAELAIIREAEASRVIPETPPHVQLLNVMWGFGELLTAENSQDPERIKHAVGDMVASLIVYCTLHDIGLMECINKLLHEVGDARSSKH